MRKLSPTEVRFQIKFALMKLPRSTLQDLLAADDKRQPALDLAADAVMARFERLEVHGPDAMKNHG